MKQRIGYDHKTLKNTAEALVEARAKLSIHTEGTLTLAGSCQLRQPFRL